MQSTVSIPIMVDLIAFWMPIVLIGIGFICVTLLFFCLPGQKKLSKSQVKKKSYKRIPITHPKKSLSQIERDRRVRSDHLTQYKERFISTPPAPVAKPEPPLPAPPPGSKKYKRVSVVHPKKTSPSKHTAPVKTSVPISRRSHPLEGKLLSLLHGDRSTAERLLKNIRLRYPDQSDQWILEKTIFDLTRDRH